MTYTTLLKLAQPTPGTEDGSWGTTVNDALTAPLDIAVGGTATIDVTSGNVVLTNGDGSASNQARYAVLRITGTPGTTRNVEAPGGSTSRNWYVVRNESNGSVVIKQNATTGVTIPAGKTAVVMWSGSDYVIATVAGASSSTDNAVARFDGLSGQLIQNSAVLIADTTGDITGGKYNGLTITTSTGTLTVANGKTLTASNTLTLTGTDGTTAAFGAGLTIAAGKTFGVNNSLTLAGTDSTTMTFPGTNATIARTDAAQTFTGIQTFSSAPVLSALTASKPVFTSSGGALTSSGTLLTDQGGTGQTTYTAGDMVYYATGTAMTKLGIGTTNYVLTSSGSAPQWSAPASVVIGTATNIQGGAAGSVPYQSGASTTTFLGIGSAAQVLQVNSGGTAPEWVSSTGTGSVVRATSPTLVTPALGTPSTINLANATNLPLGSITGLGTNVATALAINVGSAGAFVPTTGSGASGTWTISINGNANTATTATTASTATNIASGGTNQVVYQSSSGSTSFTPSPSSGNLYLKWTGSAFTWDAPSGSGDVSGPASSTADGLVAFDGTSGKIIKAAGTVTVAQGGTGLTALGSALQVLRVNASATALEYGTVVSNPGGSDTQVQFNDGGSFGGDAGLTYDKTTDVLTVAGSFNGPHNGTVGATTPNTGAFTTLSASSTVSGTGFSTYLASPPAIGGTAAAAGSFTTLSASSTVSGTGFSTYLASPPAIGGTAAAAGTFTTLTANGNTTLGDATTDTITLTGTVQPGVVISGSSSGDALRITQTGAGNALLVEDDTNPDSTPFVVNASGTVGIGTSSPGSYGKLAVAGGNIHAVDQNFTAAAGGGYWASGVSTYNVGWYESSGSMLFRSGTGATTRMTLNSSGNLGLGVTPSAWGSDFKAIQVNDTGASLWSYRSGATSEEYLYLSNNSYNNNTNNIYIRDGAAVQYRQLGGTHAWFNAPSGTANTTFTFTQAMTLDASGNLGVGTTSPSDSQSFGRALEIRGSTGSAYYSATSDNTTRGYFATYSGAAYVGSETNHALLFRTNNTERARFTNGGDFGIGTTSPSSILDVQKAGTAAATTDLLELTNSGNAASMTNTGTGILFNQFYYDATTPAVADAGRIAVKTEGNWTSTASTQDAYMTFETALDGTVAERARIDSSGNLLVGTTNTNPIGSNIPGFVVSASGNISASRNGGASLDLNRYTSDGSIARFYRSAVQVGSIDVTTTATTYATSSDYRLKNTIAPMTGALAKVAALKPCTYKWNADGSDGEGFIAHELAEVCPQAVSGEKDAVDAEGNPQYQGIDTSFLVATLTAAIQEQQALITALTARVAALEGTQP